VKEESNPMEGNSEGQDTPHSTDTRKSKRLAEEQKQQELYRRFMAFEFSPEDEEILDELGI
jgi:hypothetical protein